VIGGWKKLHNEEHHIIRLTNSRTLSWAERVRSMGNKNAYRICVGEPEGKRPLGRPRRRWNDIKMNLRQDGVVWAGLICEYDNEPSGSTKCWEILEQLSNSSLFVSHLRAPASVVVGALCYNAEGLGFDTRWGKLKNFFNLPNPSSCTRHSTSNRNEYRKQKKMVLWSRARPVRRAHSLTTISEPIA
jgi:hypothetical protein